MGVRTLYEGDGIRLMGREGTLEPQDISDLKLVAAGLGEDLPEGWRWFGNFPYWIKDEVAGHHRRMCGHLSKGSVLITVEIKSE